MAKERFSTKEWSQIRNFRQKIAIAMGSFGVDGEDDGTRKKGRSVLLQHMEEEPSDKVKKELRRMFKGVIKIRYENTSFISLNEVLSSTDN